MAIPIVAWREPNIGRLDEEGLGLQADMAAGAALGLLGCFRCQRWIRLSVAVTAT